MDDESTPADTVDSLRDNPTFAAALISGDRAASERWAAAHQRAASGGAAPTSSPPATARPTPDALRGDPDFVKRLTDPFHSGHREAQRQWAEAHGAEPSKADPAATSLAEKMDAVDRPPASPSEYATPQAPHGSPPLPIEAETEWKALAHACEIGQVDYSYLTAASYDPPVTDEQGVSKLIEKHGRDNAREIVTKARGVIAALPAETREKVADWLAESGLGNHPGAIERIAMMGDRRAARTKGKP